MRDVDLDDLFDRFRGGGFLGTPPGADAVRRVHRHRRRMHAAAGGAVAALLIAAPVAGLAILDRDEVSPGPSGTPTPTAPHTPAPSPTPEPLTPTPSQPPSTQESEPTRVPAAAMLQESDLPARFAPRANGGNDWTLYAAWSYCDVPGPAVGEQLDSRTRGFAGNRDEFLNQRVVRYADVDTAEAWFVGARDAVRACDQQSERRNGFAGDQSLIVRTGNEGVVSLHVLVRQGALVAEIWQKHLTDEDAARNLGDRAAERLCAGTTAC